MVVVGADGDLDGFFNLPDFLFFDQDFILVLNLLDALFLDRMGSFFLLLSLAVAFADPFLVTSGGDLTEDATVYPLDAAADAIVDPGDATMAKASVGVVVASFTDALVMVVVATTV